MVATKRAGRSPTFGLLAGLAVTLSAVAVYSGYTVAQLRSLRRLQAETIDRNRADSLLLLRIQNNLNSLALTMRDMLDQSLDQGDAYPLIAWKGQLRRIEVDLSDAMAREERVSRATEDQRKYLAGSVAQFWDALARIFALADQGQEEEARTRIRLSLQAREEALSNAVARLLVQNNESEQQAAVETQHIYARAERNAYLFLAAMLVLIVATSLYLVEWNRGMFAQVASLSERRSELARQLISIQENTFRYISRELHDDFGQILTAIGAMLHRAGKRIPTLDDSLRGDFEEVRGIVQSTLDKIRTLSQALHPMVLDDAGLEGAMDLYLAGFERQAGVAVRYEKDGESRVVDRDVAIHVYRVLQEALNNVAKHSKSGEAAVRLRFLEGTLVLEVEDHGVGFGEGRGMGMTSMRERAELIGGTVEFLKGSGKGAMVRLTVPT
ncbi:MAG: sensor histidine kinase [Bryobacteraceae bacterium]